MLRDYPRFLILTAACAGAFASCTDNTSPATPPELQSKEHSRTGKALDSVFHTNYQTVVQELYLSYFGRAADPAGLSNFETALANAGAADDIQGLVTGYSSNPALKSLIDSFGTSAESSALYSNNSTTEFVTAIFKNVLGRAPQQAGLDFWVSAISSGRVTKGDAALSIMAGALANTTAQGLLDADLINNRITTADYFTEQVNSQNAVPYYKGAGAATIARTNLSAVTAQTNTVSYQPMVVAAVASLIPTSTSNSTATPTPTPAPTSIPTPAPTSTSTSTSTPTPTPTPPPSLVDGLTDCH